MENFIFCVVKIKVIQCFIEVYNFKFLKSSIKVI